MCFKRRERDQMITHGRKGQTFSELPCWKKYLFHQNIYAMHIEYNIVAIILGTLLDIFGNTNDHADARYDMNDMGIR